MDILTVSLIAFLGGLPIAIPAASYELLTVGMGRIDMSVVLGMLFLGVIATALAMYLWNQAFALVEAGRASLTFFAQPVVGTLLGWHFLHETISPLFLVGGLLIAAGLVIVSRDHVVLTGPALDHAVLPQHGRVAYAPWVCRERPALAAHSLQSCWVQGGAISVGKLTSSPPRLRGTRQPMSPPALPGFTECR